ncbi:MAG: hypothetical protein KDE26_22905, partial [Bacteroidetes bacterium]|nr:hypothetical protein [Bacteroidota bacterium]
MNIDEKFKSIIIKGNQDSIIPFLKRLTPAEKKALKPVIISQNEHYRETIQKGLITWEMRGSVEQRQMISAAIFTCCSQREFSQNNIYRLPLNLLKQIIAFYVPDWFEKYINQDLSEGFLRIELDYEYVMELYKEGIITPGPALINRVLPEFLFDPIRQTGSMLFRQSPEKLLQYPETLESHIWDLFQPESLIHQSDKTNYYAETRKSELLSWETTLIAFAQEKKIDRKRLLKACLDLLGSHIDPALANWMLALFEGLKPTDAELKALSNEFIPAVGSAHTKQQGVLLKYLRKLSGKPGFPVEDFLAYVPELLASETKVVVSRTLMVIESLLKKEETLAKEICELVIPVFLHSDSAIQVRAAKLIATFGKKEWEELSAAISGSTDLMMNDAREILADFLEEGVGQTLEETLIEINEQTPEILAPENQISYPETIDDLIFLASQAFENNDSLHFELLPAALLNLNHEIDETNIDLFAPTLQRAFQIVIGDLRADQGMLDHMLANFFLHYAKMMIQRFPRGATELGKVWNTTIREHHKSQSITVFTQSNIKPLAYWPEQYSKAPVYVPFLLKLRETLQFIDVQTNLPLLSTPTHRAWWIHPETLVDRLRLWQNQGATWGEADFQLAISRLWLKDGHKYLEKAQKELKGETCNLICFLLDEQALPQPPFRHPSAWWVAALTKTPLKQYQAFESFSFSRQPFVQYTGYFFWKIEKADFAFSAWDSLVKKAIFASENLSLHIDLKADTGEHSVLSTLWGK